MALKNIMPVPVKFILQAYGNEYDVSNCLENWKEIEVTMERIETSGVYVQASFPFKFRLRAYRTVKELFDTYGFNAKAKVLMYLRQKNWTYPEQPNFVFDLDFSQYEQTDTAIEIPYRKVDLYEYLKTKENVKFDIPVSEIKDELPWEFDRLKLNNRLNFNVYGAQSAPETGGRSTVYCSVGMAEMNSEIVVMDKVISKTTPAWQYANNDFYFVRANEEISGTFHIDINGIFSCNPPGWIGTGYLVVWVFFEIKDAHGNRIGLPRNLQDITESDFIKTDRGYSQYNVHAKGDISVTLKKEERCYIYFGITQNGGDTYIAGSGLNGSVSFEFQAGYDSINIDVIHPKILLNKIVQKIYEGLNDSGSFTTDIENFNTSDSDLDMIVASESVRGITDAKIHVAYKDFKEWMFAFGYEPFVNGNSLVFRKRTAVFNKNVLALPEGSLKESECADLNISVDDDCLYSAIKTGYEKQTYDEELNSRYEFNGQHDYLTEVTVTPNELEIMCPFRADCYGIEYLARTRGREKEMTSEKGDNDIFIVCLKKQPDKYVTNRDMVVSGEVPNDSLFNGKYNPRALLMMNRELIGVSARNIKFSASTNNANVLIGGTPINSNITINKSEALFEPVLFDIASRNLQALPSGENANGLVRFYYKEILYEGFISKISKNPAWNMETQWLIRKTRTVPKFTFINVYDRYEVDNYNYTIPLQDLMHSLKYLDYQPYGATSDSDWCALDHISEHRFDINILQNNTGAERTATITFVQEESRKESEMLIIQGG